jgi:hypothetical protein
MLQKKAALITGATSGIGRAFAERFASLGYDLIITGRRKKIIDAVAREISSKYDVRVSVIIAELSEDAGVRKVIRVLAGTNTLAALVNNAGYGIDGIFTERKIDEHLALARVLAEVPLRLVHAALPGMIARRKGIIINVSSLGAWTPAPINGIYGGAKAFLNIFTESLHMEVRRHGIRVQALCPGFTATDFHAQMGVEEEIHRQRMFYWMKPEDVVGISMKCLKKGKVICIPGLPNKLIRLFMGLLPRKLYYRVTEKGFKERDEGAVKSS